VILGLGIDVVEIGRIARMLEGPAGRAERFLERCFTPAERSVCEAKRDRATRYAARFAAKEAPALALSGRAASAARRLGVTRTHLTLTHDGGVAAAVVVLEGS
jgi:holo-[acyl-carrier protein] synthase